MKDLSNDPEYNNPLKSTNLSGFLLVASPNITDPNLSKTVILISNQSSDNLITGIILNKPLKQNLAQLDPKFQESLIAGVDLYYGGSLAVNQMVLTGWQWKANIFKLHFGLTYEKACQILSTQTDCIIRGFLGYLTWPLVTLEKQLQNKIWIKIPIDEIAIKGYLKEKIWEEYIKKIYPIHSYTAEHNQQDLSLN